MRILIAVHHFPPRYTGGAEFRAYRTAAALQERGHTVRVICIEQIDAGQGAEITWQDEIYKDIHVRRLSFNLKTAPDPFRWEYDNPWIRAHLQDLLQEWKPDVFHLIGGYLVSGGALQTVQQANIPTVVSLTDFWWLCKRINLLRSNGQVCSLPVGPTTCLRCLAEEKRRYRIPGGLAPALMGAFWGLQKGRADKFVTREKFLIQVLNRANIIISPSQFLAKVHRQAGIEPDRIVFSRQGRDFPNLQPALLQKTPAEQLRVGYIGQIAPLKGVHILVGAVRRIPRATLSVKIYGDPVPLPKYSARLHNLANGDDRLDFAGVYRPDELSQVLQNLDVLVIPSVWYENSPNVILEAFAHQTPVIVSNLGGMAELVQPGKNGLGFNPGDEADLARQLQRLLDEPGLLAALRQGIEPIKGKAQEIDELEAFYRQVTRAPAGPG